jgi:hypothetical protein
MTIIKIEVREVNEGENFDDKVIYSQKVDSESFNLKGLIAEINGLKILEEGGKFPDPYKQADEDNFKEYKKVDLTKGEILTKENKKGDD